MKEFFKEFSIYTISVLIIVFSFLGFLQGFTGESAKPSGCARHSLSDYFPPYLIGCELAKRRW